MDIKLSGLLPNFQIPTNTRAIQRLPSGPDYCSIYYDDVDNTMMIDLLEGNFASDINNISYTPTQKSMKKCIEDEGKVVVRWIEYIESDNLYEEEWLIKTSTQLFSVVITSLKELQDLSLWVKFPYTAIPVNSIGRVQGYYGETLVSIWRDGATFINDTTILSYMGYWDDKEPAEKMEARYIRNGAPRWISNFVAGGNANGTAMEDFLIHVYDCISNYSPSGADVSLFDSLAEVKTTSIWGNGSGKWQHIEPNHNWEILLLVRIEYQSIDVYLMCRNEFEKAKSDGSVTEQGKSGTSYEGWWFSPWERALPYATLVESITVDPDEKGYGDCNELRRALVECLES